MAPSQLPQEKAKEQENLLAGTVKLLTLQTVENSTSQMEIDPPISSAATPSHLFTKEAFPKEIIKKNPPKEAPTPDIEILGTKNSQIDSLVKAHVENFDKFNASEAEGDTSAMKLYLRQAQMTQKSLHKLISNKEVESYVKNWNPWDQYKKSFPSKKEGKKKSSSTHHMRGTYTDKNKWAHVARIAEALKGCYDSQPGSSR